MADEPVILTEPPRGATVNTTYVERDVKAYAVHEYEVGLLSFFNTMSTIFFAVAAFFLSSAISFFANALFYETLTPAGYVAQYYLVPLLLLLSVICGGIGAWLSFKRSSTWRDIRDQSRIKPD